MASEPLKTKIKLKVTRTDAVDKVVIDMEAEANESILELKRRINEEVAPVQVDQLRFEIFEMKEDKILGDYIDEERAIIQMVEVSKSGDREMSKQAFARGMSTEGATVIYGAHDNFKYHYVHPRQAELIEIKGVAQLGIVTMEEGEVNNKIFQARRFLLPERPKGETIDVTLARDNVEGLLIMDPEGNPLKRAPAQLFKESELKSRNQFDRVMDRALPITNAIVGVAGVAVKAAAGAP